MAHICRYVLDNVNGLPYSYDNKHDDDYSSSSIFMVRKIDLVQSPGGLSPTKDITFLKDLEIDSRVELIEWDRIDY